MLLAASRHSLGARPGEPAQLAQGRKRATPTQAVAGAEEAAVEGGELPVAEAVAGGETWLGQQARGRRRRHGGTRRRTRAHAQTTTGGMLGQRRCLAGAFPAEHHQPVFLLFEAGPGTPEAGSTAHMGSRWGTDLFAETGAAV